MKNKLKPIEKRIFNVYIVLLVVLLLSALFLNSKIRIFEISTWNATIFKQSFYYTIPISILLTFFFTKLIVPSPSQEVSNSKRQKGLLLVFIIGVLINFMLMQSVVNTAAKLYNIYGPNQTEVLVQGDVVKVYQKRTAKTKNRRKITLTIFEKNWNKEIKFEIRKPYTVPEFFSEPLRKGSLGYLYKFK